MALCTIIYDDGYSIQPDTAEALTHKREAETTEHPVEDGSAIADHIIVKPRTFSISTNWTPRPWNDTYSPSAAPDRPERAFDILSGIVQGKKVVTIGLDGVIYKPVVIISLSMTRILADGDSRNIQLECKEIQIAQGQLVTAKVAAALKPKHKPKKKKVAPAESYPVQYYQKSWVDEYGPDGVPTPVETVAVPKKQAAPIIKKVVEPEPPPAAARLYQYELP